MASKKVAIFIPAYNAARTLPKVLDRIPNEIKQKAKEIFVIDNASPDNTNLVVLGYLEKRKMPNVTVIRNERNLGYGGSQKKAFKYCIDKGYDIMVMLHADAQYPPEKVPELIRPLERDEADLVFGSRMKGNPLKGGMSVWRYMGNRFLTMVQNKVMGMHLSEFHSGFRAYNVHALAKVPFEKCVSNYHIDTEILILFKDSKFKITEFAIPTHYGPESRSPNLYQTANYSINVLWATFRYYLSKKRVVKSKF